MGGQSVFKGALGWDDWIWWSGIGGIGLLLLMLVLCCVVCVQRAKRKGREEALAAVQARERERQTQEQAQLRYAQAQQARYPPAREASYKFSKPEPPQPTYNPYGHDDHSMHRNSYMNNAPAPKPKARRDSQQPPGQQPMQQQQQQQSYGGQAYYAMPSRDEQYQQQQQQQKYQQQQHQQHQQYGNYDTHAQQTQPPPRVEPEELPQVAAYYGRKPQPQAEPQRNSGPMMSHQYQRQQQVNPNQPLIAQYRRVSGRSDSTTGTSFVQEDPSTTANETPFVQVSTPRGSAASTASTAYSAAPSNTQPPAGGFNDRASVASSSSSSMLRAGGTLRDRIDALRDGPAPPPGGDHLSRISIGSAASLTGSQSSYQPSQRPQPPPAAPPAPPPAPAPHRLDAISSTTLSDASSTENEFLDTRYDNAFDEEAFATARSNQGLRRADSDKSIGVDDELPRPGIPQEQTRRTARGRTGTGDSTGSIEF